jgi:hypothetical protein
MGPLSGPFAHVIRNKMCRCAGPMVASSLQKLGATRRPWTLLSAESGAGKLSSDAVSARRSDIADDRQRSDPTARVETIHGRCQGSGSFPVPNRHGDLRTIRRIAFLSERRPQHGQQVGRLSLRFTAKCGSRRVAGRLRSPVRNHMTALESAMASPVRIPGRRDSSNGVVP